MSYLELGASLYVPATRPELEEIANRSKFPALRSVIFCTEDSVAAAALPEALANLRALLPQLRPCGIRRFVRVRNPEVLRTLVTFPGIEHLDGFVLPKLTRRNLPEYLRALPRGDGPGLMPTLETVEVFDRREMRLLRDLLRQMQEAGEPGRRLLCLRIGGNDLFQLLGLRRPAGRTIYETPLGTVISEIVTTFRPYGLNLTAPVFDRLDRPDVLAHEVRLDVEYGLLGKTAIHPDQVPLIESHYRVAGTDREAAERILHASAPPVFRFADLMCEPATHRAWAETTLARAAIYGVDPA